MIMLNSAQLARRGAWWRICSGFLVNQAFMITHHCLVCMFVCIICNGTVFQWYLRPDPHSQDEAESRARAGQAEDVRPQGWWVTSHKSVLTVSCLVSRVPESLSPRCLPRPSISTIQARPLPTPGTRHSDHIYQSPVRWPGPDRHIGTPGWQSHVSGPRSSLAGLTRVNTALVPRATPATPRSRQDLPTFHPPDITRRPPGESHSDRSSLVSCRHHKLSQQNID